MLSMTAGACTCSECWVAAVLGRLNVMIFVAMRRLGLRMVTRLFRALGPLGGNQQKALAIRECIIFLGALAVSILLAKMVC